MNGLHKEHGKLAWGGITPGLSSLETALGQLGTPDQVETLTNGKIYYFRDGTLQLTVLSNSNHLGKILIAGGELGTVKTLQDFKNTFGPVVETRVDKIQGPIYEGTGVRIATDFESDPPLIRWLEIF
jgi:hypothetical protein